MEFIKPNKHALSEKQEIQFLADVSVGQKIAEFLPINNKTRFFNKTVLLQDNQEVTVHTKIENNLEKYYIYFGENGATQIFLNGIQYYFKVNFSVRKQNENVTLNDIYNVLAPKADTYQKTYVIEGITFNNAPILQQNSVDNLKLDNIGVFKQYSTAPQYVIDLFENVGYFRLISATTQAFFKVDFSNSNCVITRIAYDTSVDVDFEIGIKYNATSKYASIVFTPTSGFVFHGYVKNPNTNLIFNSAGYLDINFISFESENYLSSRTRAKFISDTYSVSTRITNKFRSYKQIKTTNDLKNCIEGDFIFNNDFNITQLVGYPSTVDSSFLLKNYVLGNNNTGGKVNIMQQLITLINGELVKFERVVKLDGNVTDWVTAGAHKHQPEDILTNANYQFVSQADKDNWNQITNITWKDPVSVVSQLSTIYPTPQEGWASLVTSLNRVYFYINGTWVPDMKPVSSTNDGYLTSSQYLELLASVENNSLTMIPSTNDTATVHSKSEYDYLQYLNTFTYDIVKRTVANQAPINQTLGSKSLYFGFIDDEILRGMYADYTIGIGTNLTATPEALNSVLIGKNLSANNTNIIGIGSYLDLTETKIGLGKYNTNENYFEIGAGTGPTDKKTIFAVNLSGISIANGYINKNHTNDFEANLGNGYLLDLREITTNKMKFHDTLKHKLQFLGFEELTDAQGNEYFPVVSTVDITTDNIYGLTSFVNNLISQGGGGGTNPGNSIVYWNPTLKNMGVGVDMYTQSIANPSLNILNNVGLGHKVFDKLTEGSHNVFIGWQTGHLVESSIESVLIGKIIGINKLKTLVNSVVIGTEAGGSYKSITQSILIGAQANYGSNQLHQSTIIGRISADPGNLDPVSNAVIIGDGNNNRAINFNFNRQIYKIARPTKTNTTLPALCIDEAGELFIGNVPGTGGGGITTGGWKWTEQILTPDSPLKVRPISEGILNTNIKIEEGSWGGVKPSINRLNLDNKIDGIPVLLRNDTTSDILVPHMHTGSGYTAEDIQIYNGNLNNIYLKPKQILWVKYSLARNRFESINYTQTYTNKTEVFDVKPGDLTGTELRLVLENRPILSEYVNVYIRGLLVSPIHYVVNENTITISTSAIEYPVETKDLATVQYKY